MLPLQFLIQERENFEQVVSFRKAVKNPVLVAPVSLGWLISGKLPLKLSSDKMFVPSNLCKSLKTLVSLPPKLNIYLGKFRIPTNVISNVKRTKTRYSTFDPNPF